MFFKHANTHKTISPQEAKSIMDTRNVTLLDVRTAQEYKNGHIKNAINLEVRLIPRDIFEVIEDKDEEILVYCLSGARSRLASKALSKLGYTNVSDFGGLNQWPYGLK